MVGIAKDSQFIPHICEVNQEEDLSACRKALKHRIMYLLDLPPEMNDPTATSGHFPICGRVGHAGRCSQTDSTFRMFSIRKKEGKIKLSKIRDCLVNSQILGTLELSPPRQRRNPGPPEDPNSCPRRSCANERTGHNVVFGAANCLASQSHHVAGAVDDYNCRSPSRSCSCSFCFCPDAATETPRPLQSPPQPRPCRRRQTIP